MKTNTNVYCIGKASLHANENKTLHNTSFGVAQNTELCILQQWSWTSIPWV